MKQIIAVFIALIALTACSDKDGGAPRNMATGHKPVVAKPVAEVARPASEYYADFPEDKMEDPAGAVFEGFHIEMTPWTVCVAEAKVYSNPGEDPNWYLYGLHSGDPVTVRELDRGTRTFAAIKVANYTKFTNLCQNDED